MPTLKDHSVFVPRSRLAELLTKRKGTLHSIYDLSGDCYKGEWKNGKKEGIGELKTINGYFYLGQWKNNNKNGYGMLKKWNDYLGKYDLIYEGEWLDGYQHGQGVGFLPNGNFYEGDYKNGRRNGYGYLMCTDGCYYNGEWIDDKMDGFGIWTNPNGNYYEGEFCRDMRHGRGMYVMPEKSSVLRGVWKQDVYFSGESLILKKGVWVEDQDDVEEIPTCRRLGSIVKIDNFTSTDLNKSFNFGNKMISYDDDLK